MSARTTLVPIPSFFIDDNAKCNLVGQGLWRPEVIDKATGIQVRQFFGNEDTYSMYASGTVTNPVLVALHGFESSPINAYAGIDWIREEDKLKPGEPPLNAYHYIVGERTDRGYPVYGPYFDGMRVPHWLKHSDLAAYKDDGL